MTKVCIPTVLSTNFVMITLMSFHVQVKALMNEVLLFVGLFAVAEPRNQDILLWGKSPTAVHKLCLLSDRLQDVSHLTRSLNCTLLAVCASNYRVCEVGLGLKNVSMTHTYCKVKTCARVLWLPSYG